MLAVEAQQVLVVVLLSVRALQALADKVDNLEAADTADSPVAGMDTPLVDTVEGKGQPVDVVADEHIPHRQRVRQVAARRRPGFGAMYYHS